MNKKVLFTFIATVAALAFLTWYCFGPSPHTRIGPQVNPVSSRSSAEQAVVDAKNLTLSVYQNKDRTENFYLIKFPKAWRLHPKSPPGSYVLTFAGGTARVELMDVPDNSTLELYILSQEEPRLKTSARDYKRIHYQKASINGNEAFRLVYSETVHGKTCQTAKTFVAGPDMAAVITLTVTDSQRTAYAGLFDFIVNSFRWENK
jgi:hypothetical protein